MYKGDCKFPNRHTCNDKQPHHAYLCSNNTNERKVGGVNFTAHDYELPIENVLSVLEDLGIEPAEVIWQDIFANVSQGDVVDSDSSSEDEGYDVHVGSIGGLNSSKMAQVGIEMCYQCFGATCECCDASECVSDAPMHDVASIESLHISEDRFETTSSMSMSTADCPRYEPASLERDETEAESSGDDIPE